MLSERVSLRFADAEYFFQQPPEQPGRFYHHNLHAAHLPESKQGQSRQISASRPIITQKHSHTGSSIARMMPATADARQDSRPRRLQQGFTSNTPSRRFLCVTSILRLCPVCAASAPAHREKIRNARPCRTWTSTAPSGASLLTVRESARSTVLSCSGYLAPRMVTPSRVSSMGSSEK